MFHAEGRSTRQDELEAADVVLTTYGTLSAEFKAKSEGPARKKKKGKNAAGILLDIKWKRVVLDEGHTIRNPKVSPNLLPPGFQQAWADNVIMLRPECRELASVSSLTDVG